MKEYIIETRTAKTPWQREADSPAYSTRATADHVAMTLEPVNDDGYTIEYRVREVEATVRCECGAWSGERCCWVGSPDETVLVEFMPEQYRESHRAGGSEGTYPHNGARRIRVERSCGARMLEHDGDWCEVVS